MKKQLGYAWLEATTIYLDVVGEEGRELARGAVQWKPAFVLVTDGKGGHNGPSMFSQPFGQM